MLKKSNCTIVKAHNCIKSPISVTTAATAELSASVFHLSVHLRIRNTFQKGFFIALYSKISSLFWFPICLCGFFMDYILIIHCIDIKDQKHCLEGPRASVTSQIMDLTLFQVFVTFFPSNEHCNSLQLSHVN